MHVLMGLDDTDVLGHKPGTGRLARELAADLAERGLARALGVVRQQLLVDPRIPYTSHNSPACMLFEVADEQQADRLFDAARASVIARAAIGSDPGLCLARHDQCGPDVSAFGHQASTVVLTKSQAVDLGTRLGVRLVELGGTGDGIIGALAAVGLTAEGNAGRFLDLPGGLRDLPDPIPARELRARGLTLVCTAHDAHVVPHDAQIETENRIRPRLIGGRPVLLIERTEMGWRCADRKRPKGEYGEHA